VRKYWDIPHVITLGDGLDGLSHTNTHFIGNYRLAARKPIVVLGSTAHRSICDLVAALDHRGVVLLQLSDTQHSDTRTDSMRGAD
jgi:hypothetical protein